MGLECERNLESYYGCKILHEYPQYTEAHDKENSYYRKTTENSHHHVRPFYFMLSNVPVHCKLMIPTLHPLALLDHISYLCVQWLLW